VIRHGEIEAERAKKDLVIKVPLNLWSAWENLSLLFPGAALHAYTATATEQVRRDISKQLARRLPKFIEYSAQRASSA
jgi:hypothetical protein